MKSSELCEIASFILIKYKDIMNKKSLFLSVCLLIQFSAVAQQLDSAGLGDKFSSYFQNNFQEKIYVHTDKNSYVAGEIIWFKLYNTEAFTNRPVSNSKVAYLEVLDAENKPVLATKVELADGRGSGSLYLPVTLSSGTYVLRSYTSWMKNFDASYYFHKDIAIYNSLKEEEAPAKATAKKYSIQFFPEGGNLVLGMNSRIAFKAVDDKGQHFSFRGAVLNSNNDTLLTFSPQQDGLGSFYLKPGSIQAYRVVITPANEKPFYAALPKVFERGAVMSITAASDSVLNISVQASFERENNYTLFVHSGHKAVFTQNLSAGSVSRGFKVPVRLLGDGINHFTLFNSAQQPLCDRLYFKLPSRLARVSVSTDKQEYTVREKVGVSVSERGQGKPLKANFSIAVYKADSLIADDEDIATSLWLTSELKGKVTNASWYLKNYSDEVIDNLMLTHGWRRFKWEDVLQERKQNFKFLPEMQGHIISGRIIKKDTGLPVAGRNAFLAIPDRRVQLYTAYSNKNGEVNFFTKNFNSISGVIAQADPREDSLTRIEISSPYSRSFSDYKPGPFNSNPDPESLLQRSVSMQVNNAFYAGQLNKEYLPAIDSSAFYVKADKVYKLDNYVRFKTMEEVLREYVSEIDVGIRKKEYHLNMFDTDRREYMIASPLILLDGVPIFDNGNTIIGIDPRKVERLELVTGSYVYGSNVFSGIASFHTYRGDMAGMELPHYASVQDYDGLQNKREFYSPMYEGDTAQFSRLPDHRTTLFWSADNETGKDGTAAVSFFTSDLPGKYYVIVQSLSADGEAGSQVAGFTVAGKSISQVDQK